MKHQFLYWIPFVFVSLFFSESLYSQAETGRKYQITHRSTISFTDIIEFDNLYPELKPRGRRIKNKFEIGPAFNIDPDQVVYQAAKDALSPFSALKEPSPEPEIDFQGLDDSGNSIPPDVNGAAGPDHLMVTLNTDTRIMDKEGNPIATVGTGSFWQGIPGAGGVFDPKIYYDPFDERWIYTMPSSGDPTATRVMVAVSETSDPTGNWYRYSFDADPTDTYWFDYPNFGFNKKWFVLSGNMSSSSSPVHGVLFIFNKEDLYNYAFTINYTRVEIEIGDGLSLIPAKTMDKDEEDIYIVNHAGGNVGGYGYLNLRKVTGSVNDPQVEVTGLVGVPYPWHEWGYFDYGDFAPQLGSDEKINTVDARFQNLIFRNNKLWCTHHIYLPADDPTRSAIQWWELDTGGNILQWGRVDGEADGMSYAFPSIAVNAIEDVMIGYASFSEEQYASSSYSFRYADDPVSTLRDSYQYKDGLAPYYKTFGGNRNRWGDYSSTCVDPVNDLDFWTLQEYAEVPSGQDEWGVWWAKVNAEAMPEAQFAANITAVPVGSGADFYDLSKFEPVEWKWIFEGGTPSESTEQNPQNIVYDEVGLYDVTLVAANVHGTDTLTLEDYMDVNTTILPEVVIAVSDTIPCMGEEVLFTDMSIYNPHTWFWEFSPPYVTFMNGTDATSENPQVIFEYPFEYDVTLTATNNNGSASLTRTALVKAGGQPLPFYENFESWSFDRMGWTIENPDDDKTWEITAVEGTDPGGLAAYVNIKSYDGLNERDRLISPPLNLDNYKDVVLSFQFAYSQRFAQYTDSLVIYVSSDCGESWEWHAGFGEDGSGSFATAGPMMDNFIPQGPEHWCGPEGALECVDVDLSKWSGQPNIRILFESFNGFGNNLFIDNVVVDGTLIGVDEQPVGPDFVRLYPNPSAGRFSVESVSELQIASIQVYSLEGTRVWSRSFNNNVSGSHIDLTHCKPGIYFVEVSDGIQSTIRKLILK